MFKRDADINKLCGCVRALLRSSHGGSKQTLTYVVPDS